MQVRPVVLEKLKYTHTHTHIICAHGLQSGRPDADKIRFYDESPSERNLGSSSQIVASLGDLIGHVGKCAEGFEGVHG